MIAWYALTCGITRLGFTACIVSLDPWWESARGADETRPPQDGARP